jgi:hypothetical protein
VNTLESYYSDYSRDGASAPVHSSRKGYPVQMLYWLCPKCLKPYGAENKGNS